MIFVSPPIVTNGLTLYLDAANQRSYPGTGTIWTDLSGNGNNGTLTNGPTYNSSNAGSIVFDGVNDYVNIGARKLQYQDNFTIEAFAMFPSLPANAGVECGARHPIIANTDYGYNIMMLPDGRLRFYVCNTVSTSVDIIATGSYVGNKYFHVAGIKNGAAVSFYINGPLAGSGTLTTANQVYYKNDANDPLAIGGYHRCGSKIFYAAGNIPIVRIYNRALTASEVLQNYNAHKGRFGN